jgi:uncharacterized protein YfaS (alpha-2-macroglobulin family)
VEEFTPPRLDVTVTPGARHFSPKAGLPVDLKADYLFGAPGARLRYDFGYRASPLAFRPEGFAGYVFGDGERPYHTWTELDYRSGTLDGQGAAALVAEAGDDWLPEALLRVQLIASVQEDGGRWVSQTAYAT